VESFAAGEALRTVVILVAVGRRVARDVLGFPFLLLSAEHLVEEAELRLHSADERQQDEGKTGEKAHIVVGQARDVIGSDLEQLNSKFEKQKSPGRPLRDELAPM
jgi:hypothetical protein